MEPLRANVYACYFYFPSAIAWLIRLRDYLRHGCRIPWKMIPAHAGLGVRRGCKALDYSEEIVTGVHREELANLEALVMRPGLIRLVPLHAEPEGLYRMRLWLKRNDRDRYDFLAIADCALPLPLIDHIRKVFICSTYQLAGIKKAGFKFAAIKGWESPLDAMLTALRVVGRPAPIRRWPFAGPIPSM